MDILFFVACGIVAIVLLAAIACPEKFLPDNPAAKTRKVGSSYWGVYEGSDPSTSAGEIEVKPMGNKQKTVYGATSYSQGRGVSRRGA